MKRQILTLTNVAENFETKSKEQVQKTVYTYDKFGRATCADNYDSHNLLVEKSTSSYSSNGVRRTSQDGKGNSSVVCYDLWGRITTATDTPVGGPAETSLYQYDKAGNLVYIESSDSTATNLPLITLIIRSTKKSAPRLLREQQQGINTTLSAA